MTEINSDKNKLFFSIIITCYNYKDFIRESIESALSQTYKNFELIIINDGSTDSSWEVISEYSTRAITISTANRGFINACLRGLSEATGSHVMFLDADDVLLPQTLSTAACIFHDPNVVKVQFMMQPIDEIGLNIGVAFPYYSKVLTSKELRDSIVCNGCYATPPTSGNIYRRDIYDNIGNVNYDYGIDGVAYLLAPFVGAVVHVPKVLAKYRIHGQNMSTSGISLKLISRNERVFTLRLLHLKEILYNLKIEIPCFEIKKDYSYLIDCQVATAIMNSKRPSFQLFLAQIRSGWSDTQNIGSLVTIIYSVMLFALPRTIAKNLLMARMDQGKMRRIRTILKKLIPILRMTGPMR